MVGSDVFPIEIVPFLGTCQIFGVCRWAPFLWWKIHSTPFSRAWITADLLGFAVLALAWLDMIEVPILMVSHNSMGVLKKNPTPTKYAPPKKKSPKYANDLVPWWCFFENFPVSDIDVATAREKPSNLEYFTHWDRRRKFMTFGLGNLKNQIFPLVNGCF